MSSFPALAALRAACFPNASDPNTNTTFINAIIDLISKRVMTQPRNTATTLRHPGTQAGLVLEEDGASVLRAGHMLYDHSIGATLTLRPDGTVVITAPAGLILSGSVITSDTPTEAFHMNGLQFAPRWENFPLITTLNAALLATAYVAPAPGAPATVPLATILQAAMLYQTPADVIGAFNASE